MFARSPAIPGVRRRVPVLLSIAAFGIACGGCGRSETPAAPASGLRVYVSDETGNAVVVVDPEAGRVVDRLAVGKRPRGLRLSADGRQLFVALSGSPIGGPDVDESKLPPPDRAADGIGVLDLSTHRLVRTYASGPDPETFDVSRDGKILYVSNEDAAEMSVLDLSSGSVRARVKVGGEPEGVTLRPDGREVYVSCEADNEVFAIDTTTLSVVGRMQVGPRPRAIAFTPDGKIAFVTTENGRAVDVLDAERHTVSGKIPMPEKPDSAVPPRPMGVVLSLDGSQMFVSLGRAQSIAVIDTAARKAVRTIEEVGARPWGIGLSPDGRTLYSANGPSGDVSVIDIAAGKVGQRVAVGGSPWGIAVADRR
jgi:YVTN family beta-propeller protein